MIPWASSAMRATGRSAPRRRGVRDHTYNKPVVPFETRVSRARDLHSVRRVAVWGGRRRDTRRLWEAAGPTDQDTGGSPKPLTMTFLEEDTPIGHSCHLSSVPQLSLPVSYLVSYLLNVTERPKYPKAVNRDPHELFSVRSDRQRIPSRPSSLPIFFLCVFFFLFFSSCSFSVFYFDARHAP